MQESDNIKEFLFNYISNSEKITKFVSESKFAEIIIDVLENCYEKILLMGEKDESVGVLATGLLHFLLTASLIPSQRKVEFRGIQIDIVIPDLKTLENDPKKTLLICIPKTSDVNSIEKILKDTQKIQPNNENIWLVLTKEMDFKNKTFVVKNDTSFSKIIYEIAQFTNVNQQNKFKILRI
jgi:hypothetical protein